MALPMLWRGASAAVIFSSAASQPTGNCDLAQLNIWSGESALTLSPAFQREAFQYSATLDYQDLGLWVDPVIPSHGLCQARRSDSTERIKPGKFGTLSVSVRSSSKKLDHAPNEYSVLVNRRSGDDTTLVSLSINGGRMFPEFQPHIMEYSVFPVPNIPLVLVGIPTDAGQRLDIASVTPQDSLSSAANFKVLSTDEPVNGLLPPRGSANLTLGTLTLDPSGHRILRLPYSLRAGGNQDVRLPARVVLRVAPAAQAATIPGSYVMLLNAPRYAGFQKFLGNPGMVAFGMLDNAASQVDRASQKAAKKAKQAEALAKQQRANTVTGTTTTMQVRPDKAKLPSGYDKKSTTTAPKPTPEFGQAGSSFDAGETGTTKKPMPDWMSSSDDGTASGQNEPLSPGAEEKKVKTDLDPVPFIIGLTIVLTLVLLANSCRIWGRPIHQHCLSWIRAETQPFFEIGDPNAPALTAPVAPVQLRQGTAEDAARLRAMVLGTT